MNIQYIPTFRDERGETILISKNNEGKPTLVYSTSRANTMKGFHFQTKPWVAKRVHLLRGAIISAIVDLDYANGNFGFVGFQDIVAPKTIFIPEGHAYGYLAITDVEIIYEFIPYWDVQSTYSIDLYDEQIGMKFIWDMHIRQDDVIMSMKDRNGISLDDVIKKKLIYV